MAKVASKSTRFYVDQYAFSGFLNAGEMELTQELGPCATITDNGPRVVIGSYGHRHTLRGFFDGSSSQIDAVTHALIGTTSDHYLAEMFGGNTTGSIVYESIVELAGKPIRAQTGQAIVTELTLDGAGEASRSRVLVNATITSSGLGAGVDNGAASVAGSHYQSVIRFVSGGFTNAVVIVQHSSNDSTWGDTTMTLTSTGNAKIARRSTTDAVLQYVRYACTTFAGTDAHLIVTAGPVTS